MAGADETRLNHSKTVVPLNTWILISSFKLSYNLLRHSDGTFNRDLAEFLDRKVSANAVPINGVFSIDVINKSTGLLNRVYASSQQQFLQNPHRIFPQHEIPLSSAIVPVVLFFHGGSFAHSSANSAIYDTFCRRMVQEFKAVVVSVNYRRSPEHRYPCAYEDGWEALLWVKSRPWLRSGEDGSVHVYLVGDSSGGNMVHHVAKMAAGAGVEVSGNVMLHPLFGGEERKESERRLDGKYFVGIQDRDWYWSAFLPEGEDRDHPACNPFGPRGEDDMVGMRFAKSMVVVAGLDLIQDWQISYAERMKECGQEVKLLYLKHATIGFYFMPNNEHFHRLMKEMQSFMNPP